MGKRMLARLGAAVAGGALAFTMAAPALADHVAVETTPAGALDKVEDPTEADVNESTGPAHCDADSRVKIEGVEGDFPWTGGPGDAITVTEQDHGEDGPHYTITTDGSVVITEAHLKGGGGEDAYTSFYFDPSVTEASNLWTTNNAGKIAELSHVWICFDEPEEPGNGKSPSPTPTEPPTETTPPENGETTPPAEKKPELPVTGAQVGGLLLLGGGLLAGGIAMIAVRRRRNLADLLDS
jgi:LPXTG-motif cell wall-anchored protein